MKGLTIVKLCSLAILLYSCGSKNTESNSATTTNETQTVEKKHIAEYINELNDNKLNPQDYYVIGKHNALAINFETSDYSGTSASIQVRQLFRLLEAPQPTVLMVMFVGDEMLMSTEDLYDNEGNYVGVEEDYESNIDYSYGMTVFEYDGGQWQDVSTQKIPSSEQLAAYFGGIVKIGQQKYGFFDVANEDVEAYLVDLTDTGNFNFKSTKTEEPFGLKWNGEKFVFEGNAPVKSNATCFEQNKNYHLQGKIGGEHGFHVEFNTASNNKNYQGQYWYDGKNDKMAVTVYLDGNTINISRLESNSEKVRESFRGNIDEGCNIKGEWNHHGRGNKDNFTLGL